MGRMTIVFTEGPGGGKMRATGDVEIRDAALILAGMKDLRVIRLVAGWLFLLPGLVFCFLFFGSGSGGEVSLSTTLFFLIAGLCLLCPGVRGVRNVMGAVFLGMFFLLAPGAGNLGTAVMVMALLILAAIMFSGTLSQWVARPFTGFVDFLYFGNNPVEPPPVNLRLARAYRRDLRFEEAVGECERILQYHPRSLAVWCELLHAVREKGSAEELARCFHKARSRLKGHDRGQLDFEFQRHLPGAAV